MSQMAMLYKYEFRKIAKRKIIWISLLISVIIILPTIGGPVLDFLYESSGTETAYQAFLKDREYEKKLEGRLIDQSLLEETMEAYGKIPQTEGPYSATEEYRTYARPYSAIFRFVRVMTDMTVNESLNWEADEQELYAGNRVLLMRTADRYRLTPEETEFWLRQEEQKPWPVEYRYKEGWWRLLDCVYTIGLLAIMVTAICLSGPFVEEHTRKTDQPIWKAALLLGEIFGGTDVCPCSFPVFHGSVILYRLCRLRRGGIYCGFSAHGRLFPFRDPGGGGVDLLRVYDGCRSGGRGFCDGSVRTAEKQHRRPFPGDGDGAPVHVGGYSGASARAVPDLELHAQ